MDEAMLHFTEIEHKSTNLIIDQHFFICDDNFEAELRTEFGFYEIKLSSV